VSELLRIAGCLEKATGDAYDKRLSLPKLWFGFLFHAWARRALNHTEETVTEVLVLTGKGLVLSAERYFGGYTTGLRFRTECGVLQASLCV
jgi:hypothetical protein